MTRLQGGLAGVSVCSLVCTDMGIVRFTLHVAACFLVCTAAVYNCAMFAEIRCI